MSRHRLYAVLALGALAAAPVVVASCGDSGSAPTAASALDRRGDDKSNTGKTEGPKPSQEVAEIELFAPEDGDRVGVDGVGWFIDIAVVFEQPVTLRATGFTANQLTGPGGHDGIAPFPGSFGLGKDEKLPGLVTLVSTLQTGAKGCQNISNTYNLTGVTNVSEDEIELWDTYIVGAPIYGRHINSTLYIAEVADNNHNGVFDDAPDIVPDVNKDGRCDETDVEALGLASEVAVKNFFIR